MLIALLPFATAAGFVAAGRTSTTVLFGGLYFTSAALVLAVAAYACRVRRPGVPVLLAGAALAAFNEIACLAVPLATAAVVLRYRVVLGKPRHARRCLHATRSPNPHPAGSAGQARTADNARATGQRQGDWATPGRLGNARTTGQRQHHWTTPGRPARQAGVRGIAGGWAGVRARPSDPGWPSRLGPPAPG